MATILKYETAGGATLYAVRYRTPERHQTMKRGFRTKRDAQDFANSVEVDMATGVYVKPSRGKITAAELAPEWLERKKQAHRAEPLPDVGVGVAGACGAAVG
jgi:hypothetical protein